ncbi:hypothetical protein SLEP1_g60294, partial [Rubroshorea leprosula]
IFACLLCLFSPLQPDINQPFPTPPPEKLKIPQICCLLPPLAPVAAGCELRFSCGSRGSPPIFRQLFPYTRQLQPCLLRISGRLASLISDNWVINCCLCEFKWLYGCWVVRKSAGNRG